MKNCWLISAKLYHYAKSITKVLEIWKKDQTSVYFDMLSYFMVNKKCEKPILLKLDGYEKSIITVMLAVIDKEQKLRSYVILICK